MHHQISTEQAPCFFFSRPIRWQEQSADGEVISLPLFVLALPTGKPWNKREYENKHFLCLIQSIWFMGIKLKEEGGKNSVCVTMCTRHCVALPGLPTQRSAWLHLPSAEIKGICHHTQLLENILISYNMTKC